MNVGTGLWIILGVVCVMIIWVVAKYNQLVSLRNRIENAWSQIDVQLKRRYDLIPNLVETVKGYAAHEKGVLEDVTKARTEGMNAGSVKEQGEAQNALSSTLKSLFAVAENYPDLKANQNFMMLQEELAGTEDKIRYARQFYNDQVMEYNTITETFPGNVIASTFGFHPHDYFPMDDAAREPVNVKF